MLMNGTNGNEPGYPENALVPYPVIVAATRATRRTTWWCSTTRTATWWAA